MSVYRKMTRQDKADRRTANDVVVFLGHLQHAQDHRLTDREQTVLSNARGVLMELSERIRRGDVL